MLILSNMRFAFWEAALLFALWFAQFLRAELRDEISWVYAIWAVVLLADSFVDRTRWRAPRLFWKLLRSRRQAGLSDERRATSDEVPRNTFWHLASA